MGALSDLLHRANPANAANRSAAVGSDSHNSHDLQPNALAATVRDSRDSQDSHALGAPRHALQQAAIAEGRPTDLVARLDDADVLACADVSADTLRVYLCALARSQHMAAGVVPDGWSRAAECAGCGPVLLWRDAPASVIACPWCWHRKAGRMIPRPRGG